MNELVTLPQLPIEDGEKRMSTSQETSLGCNDTAARGAAFASLLLLRLKIREEVRNQEVSILLALRGGRA
jgi:hypothetical protein